MNLSCYLDADISTELLKDKPALNAWMDATIERELDRWFDDVSEVRENRKLVPIDHGRHRLFFSVTID